METIQKCFADNNYILDPHGACGYRALKEGLKEGEAGIFCETAHPAKFLSVVEKAIGTEMSIPDRLAEFMKGTKQSVAMSKEFTDFKAFLMQQ